MTTSAMQLTQEQKNIFEAMPKAWQIETRNALAIQSNFVRSGVLGRYDIGAIAAKFTKNESNYGEEAIINLGKVLNESEANLYQYRQFAGVYARSEVQSLLERAEKAGYRLTWAHFDTLSGLAGNNGTVLRKALEKACFVERLTLVQLREKVHKRLGKRSQGGRKIVRPRNVAAGVNQMTKIAEQVDKRWKSWEESIFTEVQNAGADTVDDELLQTLEAGKKAQEQLLEQTKLAVAEYEKAVARVKKLLERKALPAPKPATPPPAAAGKIPAGKKLVKILRRPGAKPAAAASAKDSVAKRIQAARATKRLQPA